jgi:hypothetical protein
MESNHDGAFDTFHIRRGDFQYKETRIEADELYQRSKAYIPEGSVLYIATDEKKKEFFNVLKDHYKVYFLDDFKHLVCTMTRPHFILFILSSCISLTRGFLLIAVQGIEYELLWYAGPINRISR